MIPRFVYILSDVHNCVNELIEMIRLIEFDYTQDELIILGDCFDRGPHPIELFDFITQYSHNENSVPLSPGIRALRGNHDHWLAQNLMRYLDGYRTFSMYNSLGIITRKEERATIMQMVHWIYSCPLHMEFSYTSPYGEKKFLLAHAMTATISEIGNKDTSFFLMGQELEFSYLKNGVDASQGTVSLIGHTPTNIIRAWVGEEYRPVKSEIWMNRHENPSVIAVDCGCGFRGDDKKNRLGCIRLNDYQTFYV